MKKVYLVVVAAKDGRSIERKFVTDDLSCVVGKYSMFTVESIDFVNADSL